MAGLVPVDHLVNLVFYLKFLLFESNLFDLFVVTWVGQVCKFKKSLYVGLMLVNEVTKLRVGF